MPVDGKPVELHVCGPAMHAQSPQRRQLWIKDDGVEKCIRIFYDSQIFTHGP